MLRKELHEAQGGGPYQAGVLAQSSRREAHLVALRAQGLPEPPKVEWRPRTASQSRNT